jgi:hypothetical protein
MSSEPRIIVQRCWNDPELEVILVVAGQAVAREKFTCLEIDNQKDLPLLLRTRMQRLAEKGGCPFEHVVKLLEPHMREYFIPKPKPTPFVSSVPDAVAASAIAEATWWERACEQLGKAILKAGEDELPKARVVKMGDYDGSG